MSSGEFHPHSGIVSETRSITLLARKPFYRSIGWWVREDGRRDLRIGYHGWVDADEIDSLPDGDHMFENDDIGVSVIVRVTSKATS